MKKVFRILLWSALTLVVLLGLLFMGFMYKVKNGLPIFETEIPKIDFPANQEAVLLFTKSTGFRHSGSIDASKPIIAEMAKKNNWFLYETEEGGVFNTEQLAKFNVVIFDNSTGRLLNDEQKTAFEKYVENGGNFMGIHGAGDNSHLWPWYTKNLTGSDFSHHALPEGFKLQNTEVSIDSQADSLTMVGIPSKFNHADEWYVFYENPRKHGFNIVASIDGSSVETNGNMKFLASDKNFGMGKDHTVAWYKAVGKGKSFYTSMGHDESCWKNENFVKLVENGIRWSVDK
jgi:type 1 glutamine amidotransferase